MESLFSDAYQPFTIATLVIAGILLLEMIGVTSALTHDVEIDTNGTIGHDTEIGADHDGITIAHALGIGQGMPLSIWLVCLLATFAITGTIFQNVLELITGAALPGWVAAGIILVPALLINRLTATLVYKVMPKDETDAVTEESFLGQYGELVRGPVNKVMTGEAKLVTRGNIAHRLPVVAFYDEEIPVGAQVLILRREKGLYQVQTTTPTNLHSL